MNERIAQLLAQAHLEVEDVKDTNKIAERFAELIVKECTDVLEKSRPSNSDSHLINDYMYGMEHGYVFAIEVIKQHFGVE